MSDLAVGTRLGAYLLERLLGRGGMGAVWLARDGDEKPVALKILRDDLVSNRGMVKRLQKEARAGQKVAHPNVVRTFDCLEEQLNGSAVRALVLEYVQGQSIRDLARVAPLPDAQVRDIGRQAAAGLAAIHMHQIVHKDVKPENLMLGEDGVVRVMDMGISLLVDETMTVEGNKGFEGSLAYASPEQFRTDDVSFATDQYSLGVTLYELATGRNPFKQETPALAIHAHMTQVPEKASVVNPEISPFLSTVLARCMAKEPANRFASMEELAAVLGHGEESSWWRTELTGVEVVRTNLPHRRSSFVGRADEIRRVRRLLEKEGAQLVTVIGAGGTGKTRFSQQVGAELVGQYPGGVWFCDLTEARSIKGICKDVGAGLDVALTEEDAVEQITGAIRGRDRTLIILDNLEQVIDLAPETLGRWLDEAPRAQFLVTSRESLRMEGEQVYPLEPLTLPLRIEDAHLSAAVQLFVRRGEEVKPGFTLDPANTRAICEIVRHLDGIPLAIELAAARVRILPPTEILKRMPRRFDLLRSARRDASARQATLRGAIDWSWDLLEPWERAALAQCSVFRGGFFLEAAEAVLDLSAWPEAAFAMDVVQSLHDKSLLNAQPAPDLPDQPRFALFESIREYAAERLMKPGALDPGGELRFEGTEVAVTGPEAAEHLVRRHAAHFAGFGSREFLRSLSTHGGGKRRKALALDLENLLASVDRSLEMNEPDVAADAVGPLLQVLFLKGPLTAAAEYAQQVVRHPGLSADRRPRVLALLAEAYHLSGRIPECSAAWEEALVAAREVGDRHTEAQALRGRCVTLSCGGSVEEARTRGEESLALARELGSPALESGALCVLGNLAGQMGQLDAARELYEKTLALHREVGDRMGEGSVLSNLGNVHVNLNENDEAKACFEEALKIARETDNRVSEAIVLGNLGNCLSGPDQKRRRRTCYEAAVSIRRETGQRMWEVGCLANLAQDQLDSGELETARETIRQAVKAAAEVGSPMEKGYLNLVLADLSAAEGKTEEAMTYYDGALQVAKEGFIPQAEGVFHIHRCSLCVADGCLEKAHQGFQAALGVARSTGNRHLQRHALQGLGVVLAGAGRLDDARTAYYQARDIELPEELPTGGIHSELARDLLVVGYVERARQVAEQGIQEAQEDGDPAEAGVLHQILGEIAAAVGFEESAIGPFQTALELLEESGDRQQEGEARAAWGNLLIRLDRQEEAREQLELALELAREHEDRETEGRALAYLADLLRLAGQLEDAEGLLAKAEKLLRAEEEVVPLVELLCRRGHLHLARDNRDSARRALEEARVRLSRLGASPEAPLRREVAGLQLALEDSGVPA